MMRQTTEFVVDDRHQEGERKLIPVAPRSEKRVDVAWNWFTRASAPMHRAAPGRIIYAAFSFSSTDSSFAAFAPI